jgi:hypothetical protein
MKSIMIRITLFLMFLFSLPSLPAYSAPSTYFDTVQKIYIGYYQRPADPAGLIWWARELDRNGGNLNAIIDAFASSPESQALYGTIDSTTIPTVVNDLYLALLARNAEPGGRDWYVGEFNAGRFTSATIMLNILNGTTTNPDLQSINNKLSAANLFTRTIDPELDSLNFQVTYSGAGDVIAGRNFLNFVTSDPATAQTEAGTTEYVRTNIADPGDQILSTGRIQLPKTGQTISYTTGDDGYFKKGVIWPAPRFVDNANGTVTDNLTGLIWLKDANCFGTKTLAQALTFANKLASGACGLNDGSTAGMWRLPNVNELSSMVDISQFMQALPLGHPFTNVKIAARWGDYGYWSSTINVDSGNQWFIEFYHGDVLSYTTNGRIGGIWPVRE